LLLAEGGVLYVELPLERPVLQGGGRHRGSRTRFHRTLDFFSTASRLLLGWLPPAGLLKISEHVNFFHEQSLRQAMEEAGLQVLCLEARLSWRPLGRNGTLHCLARRPLRAPE
jgi:hypothetical protein